MLLKRLVNFLRSYKIFFAWINFENIFLLFITSFYILSFICMLYYDFVILYNITFLPEMIKLLENKKNILMDNHFYICCILGKYLLIFKQIKLTPLNSFNKYYIMFNLFSKFVTNVILLKSNKDIDFRITFVVNKIQHLISNFVSPNIVNKSNFKEFSIYLELLEQFIKKNEIYLSNEDFVRIEEELESINSLKQALLSNNKVFLLNENNINDTKDRLQQLLELTDKLSIINI